MAKSKHISLVTVVFNYLIVQQNRNNQQAVWVETKIDVSFSPSASVKFAIIEICQLTIPKSENNAKNKGT